MKNRRTRGILGAVMIALGVFICLLSQKDAPRGSRRVFQASGETEMTVPGYVPPGGTVRINEADPEELTALPGVGETLAQAVTDEREKNGPFRFPEDLLAVKGIGPARLRQMLPYLDLDEEGE